MKRLQRLLRNLKFYIKHSDDINDYYRYSLGLGLVDDETLNWYQRTELWYKAE